MTVEENKAGPSPCLPASSPHFCLGVWRRHRGKVPPLSLPALALSSGLDRMCWAHWGSRVSSPGEQAPGKQWSESPASPSQPPAHPGPCSEDKAELILSGRVRLVSRAGWIRGDETNAFGQPGSRVLCVNHAGPPLRQAVCSPEGPGRLTSILS